MDTATSSQKARFLAGLLQEYPTYALEDFAIFHQRDSMLVLVLPKIHPQLQYELSLSNRSKCGLYNFHQCLNILLAHCNPAIAAQLKLPCDQVTLEFLRGFDYETRLVGKFYILQVFLIWILILTFRIQRIVYVVLSFN